MNKSSVNICFSKAWMSLCSVIVSEAQDRELVNLPWGCALTSFRLYFCVLHPSPALQGAGRQGWGVKGDGVGLTWVLPSSKSVRL